MRRSFSTVIIFAVFSLATFVLVYRFFFQSVTFEQTNAQTPIFTPAATTQLDIRQPDTRATTIGSSAWPQIDPQRLLSESGWLADPKFASVTQRYLNNLQQYRQLNFIDLHEGETSAEIQTRLVPVLKNCIQSESNSKAILSGESPAVADALYAQLSMLLSRCSGLSGEEYLKALGPESDVAMPDPNNSAENPELVKMECDKFLGGRSVPDIGAGTEEVRKLFLDLYSSSAEYHSKYNRVTGWSPDTNASFAVVRYVGSDVSHKYVNLLPNDLSPTKAAFLLGSTSQQSLVFTRPHSSNLADSKTNLLRAEIIVIVKTNGDDIYPISFHSYYDRSDGKWWLLYANRQCSPRVTTSPRLIF